MSDTPSPDALAIARAARDLCVTILRTSHGFGFDRAMMHLQEIGDDQLAEAAARATERQR